MNPIYFDHEKLIVYQKAIQFVSWADDLLQEVQRKAAVKDQLDRASTSVVLTIAEGNGKMSPNDRRHFFRISRGFAVESAACLDVFVAKRLVAEERIIEGKKQLFDIVCMLMGLINRLDSQVREEEAEYRIEGESFGFEHEHEHEHEHE